MRCVTASKLDGQAASKVSSRLRNAANRSISNKGFSPNALAFGGGGGEVGHAVQQPQVT